MNAKEHIRKELECLLDKFPQVIVRYEYDAMAEAHFVEVTPSDTYHNDNNYIKQEEDITDRFINLFPTQNICFVSDDSIVGIRNAEYTLGGR